MVTLHKASPLAVVDMKMLFSDNGMPRFSDSYTYILFWFSCESYLSKLLSVHL